jgi:hypothetical protein
VIVRMAFPQPHDRDEDAFAARECPLGLESQPRPGVRPRSSPLSIPSDRLDGVEVRVERLGPRSSQASLRRPDPKQRHNEVAASVGSHEFDRVMPLAEPDLDPIGELPLKSLPTCPVGTDGTQRHLHRDTTSLVEGDQASHAPSVAGRDTQVCDGVARLGCGFKWHSASVPFGLPISPASAIPARSSQLPIPSTTVEAK